MLEIPVTSTGRDLQTSLVQGSQPSLSGGFRELKGSLKAFGRRRPTTARLTAAIHSLAIRRICPTHRDKPDIHLAVESLFESHPRGLSQKDVTTAADFSTSIVRNEKSSSLQVADLIAGLELLRAWVVAEDMTFEEVGEVVAVAERRLYLSHVGEYSRRDREKYFVDRSVVLNESQPSSIAGRWACAFYLGDVMRANGLGHQVAGEPAEMAYLDRCLESAIRQRFPTSNELNQMNMISPAVAEYVEIRFPDSGVGVDAIEKLIKTRHGSPVDYESFGEVGWCTVIGTTQAALHDLGMFDREIVEWSRGMEEGLCLAG